MTKRDVRHGDSESLKKCEECGDVVDVLPTSATALLQSTKTEQYSVVGLRLVRCYYQGHAYYVTDLSRQVYDPFDPGEIEEE